MKHRFKLTIRRDPSGGRPVLWLETSGRVSLGVAGDGSATVALLGTIGASDAAGRLADAYLRAGRDPLACMAVDVAAVIVDHAAGHATVVAAPIGLRQVLWAETGDALTLASAPGEILGADGRAPCLDPEAVFHYVYFHMVPGPVAALPGTAKLNGGHWLRWDGQAVTVERYWRPGFEDNPTLTEAEASRELRRILAGSVGRALAASSAAGAFLSGGLDSSTVAGLAARARPGLPTVSMGFDAAGYDEMEYARLASSHFGTRPLEYYVTPDDVFATLPEIAAAFPEPFGNSSAAAAYHCARIARENGIDLLLAGDGGDELFGGNERYARQLVFERYARLPGLLRSGLLEPLVGAAARFTTGFPIGKAQSYIQQANVPLPDRLQSYNFLHRHDPSEVFSRDMLETLDSARPLRMLREEYDVPATSSAVNRMLFLDWKFTLHDNDLVKVNTMCDLAGIEVAYPLLDQALVDFSLKIPGGWKVRNGELRWFYKRAIRDFLPKPIIDKTKHGFGLPFGVWTRTHEGLRRLSEDALGSLSGRGYFRSEFLREALRLHREGHASYYGELVWVLMALELWLQAHAPGARL